MGRILSIDLGTKRTGLAVTDPLQIIASPLEFVRTHDLLSYLNQYTQREDVESFVVGMPKQLDNSNSDMTIPAMQLIKKLKTLYPNKDVFVQDERFTSKIALDSMIEGGASKKHRRIKGNIDKVSAAIILQSFLERKNR